METLHDLIGSDPETITWWQMVLRGTLIFFYTLILIRLGGRRIFGKHATFDIVLGVILGSIMSRALTANAAFVPTLAAATALVLLHRLLAEVFLRSPRLAHLAKGDSVLLIRDGVVLENALKTTNMTERDLVESLRASSGVAEPEQVHRAYLERNGDVSVVQKD